MIYFWTWQGKFFGYREFDELWTYNGKHIGKFHDQEIYGQEGCYLGEIGNENRLIRSLAKINYRKYPFNPLQRGLGIVPFANYVGYALYAGYEDFPEPIQFPG